MSGSVQPHRRQPTRLPRPWGSPGKNTGVGCHFLLQCMIVKSEREVTQSCPALCVPIDGSPLGSPVPGILQARTLELSLISICTTCLLCGLEQLSFSEHQFRYVYNKYRFLPHVVLSETNGIVHIQYMVLSLVFQRLYLL